jgi:hypothetical protein
VVLEGAKANLEYSVSVKNGLEGSFNNLAILKII